MIAVLGLAVAIRAGRTCLAIALPRRLIMTLPSEALRSGPNMERAHSRPDSRATNRASHLLAHSSADRATALPTMFLQASLSDVRALPVRMMRSFRRLRA